jgi:two-component system, cell cycle sensor histidine kinase and response regulator CckA
VIVSTVLVADGDPVVRSVLAAHLAAPDRNVLAAASPEEALLLARTEGPVDVALVDKGLGGDAGLELARRLKEARRETEIILVTAYASFETAVEALQIGLYDYVSKPIDDFDALRLKVENALEKLRLQLARREAESELLHVQKMDAIGRLAGGIGHDLANMLAVILSWTEELEAGAAPGQREGLRQIQDATDRATRLVRQMMTLSRKGPAEPARVTIQNSLDEMAKLLRRSLGARVSLVLEHAPEPWPVLVDPGHLGQVFLNLAVNARDAMPEGGRLTFRTVNLPAAGLEGGLAGPAVRLDVSDQGVGMTPEVRERAFEPFFTTKRPGEGTGLGLAIVYGIVRQASGSISIDTAPGKGTTIRITFPRAPEAPPASDRRPPGDAVVEGAAGTVLLAEDDAPLRALLVRALRRAGFEVLEAPSGEVALELARAHPGAIDLVVSDEVMPGRSGAQLVAEVRQGWPGCKALLVTGFPADPEVVAFAAAGERVVQKPFRATALVDAARALLAGR